MRMLAVIAAAVGLVASSGVGAGAASSGPGTQLRITYWEDGMAAVPTEVWTVRCTPAAGTLPRPARACRKLAALGARLFAPLPPDTVCTEIYGGPQRARVVGRVSGQRVWATFTRSDGCQIGRWNSVSPWLLPPGGVTR